MKELAGVEEVGPDVEDGTGSFLFCQRRRVSCWGCGGAKRLGRHGLVVADWGCLVPVTALFAFYMQQYFAPRGLRALFFLLRNEQYSLI